MEPDEEFATPVLHFKEGRPSHVVPFDLGARGMKPFVVVLGLWKTCTNVLVEYLTKFFDVDLPTVKAMSGGPGGWKWANYEFPEPGRCGARRGRTWWKHEPLRDLVLFPATHQGRPVLILCCIREPCRWINALAHGSYELKGAKGNRWFWKSNGKGDHRWLAEGPVQFKHPMTDEVFTYKNADSLWVEYAYGVMKGRLATQAESLRTRVVRHEDIVLQPLAVLEALVQLGLPRKLDGQGRPIQFAEVEAIKGGHCTSKDRTRDDLKNEVIYGGCWQEYCLDEVGSRLDDFGPLLDVFGYPRRTGYMQEPRNTFGALVEFDHGSDTEVEEPERVKAQRLERARSAPARRPVGPVSILR